MFREIFHLLWKTNERQVNLSFLLLRVSSSQLSARGMGAISGMTLARKSRYCPCTGWNFHPLSISVPQSPSQRFHRYSHKMLLTKILQKDPYPEHPSGESGEVCWVPSGAEGQAGDSILFSPNARLTRKIRERPGAAQTNPKFLSSSRPGHVG